MHTSAPLFPGLQSTRQHDLPAAHDTDPVQATASAPLQEYLPVPQHDAPILGMVAQPPHALLGAEQNRVVPEQVQLPPHVLHELPTAAVLPEHPPHPSGVVPPLQTTALPPEHA